MRVVVGALAVVLIIAAALYATHTSPPHNAIVCLTPVFARQVCNP